MEKRGATLSCCLTKLFNIVGEEFVVCSLLLPAVSFHKFPYAHVVWGLEDVPKCNLDCLGHSVEPSDFVNLTSKSEFDLNH